MVILRPERWRQSISHASTWNPVERQKGDSVPFF